MIWLRLLALQGAVINAALQWSWAWLPVPLAGVAAIARWRWVGGGRRARRTRWPDMSGTVRMHPGQDAEPASGHADKQDGGGFDQHGPVRMCPAGPVGTCPDTTK